jgi:hypothetical protein
VKWTFEQDAILTQRYPNEKAAIIAMDLGRAVHSIYARAKQLKLRKSVEFLASEASGRTNGSQGAATRFSKGGASWNLGKKGLDIGGKETRFKLGQMPHNHMAVGSEKIADGYVWVKLAEPKTWKQKHHLVWKEAHGDYPPKGFVLAFKDGNRMNVALENLELLSRQDWIQRHTIHQYPEPLKEVIRLSAKLRRKLNVDEQH